MKKTMKNIFNDSDDEFSDDTSVSNRRLSKPIVLNVEENDDTTEKRAKRKSMLIENGSMNRLLNNPLNSNHRSELPSGSRDERIGNHYGDCIKLAMENKITQKNAFSLHLIDYLCDYVKELRHFQTVGSSLDAGNKIYASRVDSIHQNTYQVLTGLGNPNEEVAVPDDNPVSDDETEASKTKKVKRKQNLPKNTIVQNLKKVRLTGAQIRSEVDPLFQSQAENFDEGGTCELRCNNVELIDGTFDLLLDSEKMVYTNSQEEAPAMSTDYSDVRDLDDYLDFFGKIRDCQCPFSEHFEDFTFAGWNAGSETMNSTTAESFRNMMLSAAASRLEDEEDQRRMDTGAHMGDYDGAGAMFDDYNDDNACDYGFDVADDDTKEQIPEDIVAADEEDNLVIIGTSKAESCVGAVMLTSLRDMVNSFAENYGEMNDNMLGTWAGPLYWRQKAKPLPKVPIVGDNDENNNTKKKRQPVVKPSKEVKSIFPETIDTRPNKDGIGRVVWQDNWKFTKMEHLSTQLTDVCLNKNIEKDYLLPVRSHFSLKSLNQLMNREVTLVNKVLKQHTDKLLSTEIKDESKPNTAHEFANAIDMVEFGPQPASLVADDDGNVMVYDQNDGFGDFNDGDEVSDGGDAYGGNSFHNIDFQEFPQSQQDEELPITAGVRRIEQVDIDYAKNAKRINVKKLKSEIWTTLKGSINALDVEVMKEKRYPDLPRRADTFKFSELLVAVDGKVSKEASRDLSVSILMTCLLHLSNETGLDLTNTADFSDLAIGQGYSDRDLEQIAKFGIGNCLSVSGDSRKRKSLDESSGLQQRPAKAANISNIFNDSNEDSSDDDDDADDD